MNTTFLRALATDWRAEALVLRRRGAVAQADVLESVADDFDRRLEEWEDQELTVAEAAAESGYSEDHLRELVRAGRLPDNRPPGSEGRIAIRRRDLPRKPRTGDDSGNAVGEILELLH